jgi:hypothetical protein
MPSHIKYRVRPKKRRKLYLRYLWLDLNKTKARKSTLAFETLGPWCKEAIDCINVIGNRLIAECGVSKSKKFHFERISLAIQRGNAASIRGTFPDSAILSEVFVL